MIFKMGASMKTTYFYPTENYFIGGSGEYEKVLNIIFKNNGQPLILRRFPGATKVQILFVNVLSALVGLYALSSRHQIGIMANSKFLFLIRILNMFRVPYVIDFRSNSLFKYDLKFHKRVKIILCAQHQLNYVDYNCRDQAIVIPTPFYEFPPEENLSKKRNLVTVYISSDHAYKFQMLNALLSSETMRNFKITVFVDDKRLAEKYIDKRYCVKISSLEDKSEFLTHLSKTETVLILSRSEGIPRIAIEAVWLGCRIYVPHFLKELEHLHNTYSYEKVEDIALHMNGEFDACVDLKIVRETIKICYGYRQMIRTYQDIFCF